MKYITNFIAICAGSQVHAGPEGTAGGVLWGHRELLPAQYGHRPSAGQVLVGLASVALVGLVSVGLSSGALV